MTHAPTPPIGYRHNTLLGNHTEDMVQRALSTGQLAMSEDYVRPQGDTQTNPGFGYLGLNEIANRTEGWRLRDGRPVMLGCGDEGAPSAHSNAEAQRCYPGTVPPGEGMISVYGQVAGVAKNILAVGLGEDPDFATKAGGIEGITAHLLRFMEEDKSAVAVKPAFHSDRTKERAALLETTRRMAAHVGIEIPDDAVVFCGHGTAPTGCAYCGGVGAVSNILATDSLVRQTAADNILHATGNRTDLVAAALDGHQRALGVLGSGYSFDRQMMAKSGAPVLVLERTGGDADQHAPASSTSLIINLDPTLIGPAGKDYRLDVGGATLLAIRAFPKYRLPADKLAAAYIADAAAVRAVLAQHDVSGDHTPDPRRIPVGVIGGPFEEAIAKIESLARQHP